MKAQIDIPDVLPNSAFEKITNLLEEILNEIKANKQLTYSEWLSATDFCKKYGISKAVKVLAGGKTRVESALVGVSEVQPRCARIAIHDGARPLVTTELIERTVRAAKEYYAAVPVIPSTDTLKIVDGKGFVTGTVDRASTFRVQTPQVFKADFIKGALTKAMEKNLPLTDDCSAMEMMGVKTMTLPGDEDNIKLTTPRDLLIAEAILKAREGI